MDIVNSRSSRKHIERSYFVDSTDTQNTNIMDSLACAVCACHPVHCHVSLLVHIDCSNKIFSASEDYVWPRPHMATP